MVGVGCCFLLGYYNVKALHVSVNKLDSKLRAGKQSVCILMRS